MVLHHIHACLRFPTPHASLHNTPKKTKHNTIGARRVLYPVCAVVLPLPASNLTAERFGACIPPLYVPSCFAVRFRPFCAASSFSSLVCSRSSFATAIPLCRHPFASRARNASSLRGVRWFAAVRWMSIRPTVGKRSARRCVHRRSLFAEVADVMAQTRVAVRGSGSRFGCARAVQRTRTVRSVGMGSARRIPFRLRFVALLPPFTLLRPCPLSSRITLSTTLCLHRRPHSIIVIPLLLTVSASLVTVFGFFRCLCPSHPRAFCDVS